MNIYKEMTPFSKVRERVSGITDTENTYLVDSFRPRISKIDNYSGYGLATLGKTVGFPAPFISTLHSENPALAEMIVRDRVESYFAKERNPFYAREFGRKICGIVSNRYSFFDDDEVCDIIDNSPLRDFSFQESDIIPERLHLRAIDRDNPFHVDGDESSLFLSYFIDNSMVGQSAFKIRVGIFRQVCSNGMIIPQTQFILCKAVHRGTKDISKEFNDSLQVIAEKRERIIGLITESASQAAKIEDIEEEFKEAYLEKKLNVSRKEAVDILGLYDEYSGELGSRSRWAMVNAITQFARDMTNIDRRLFVESSALAAA